MSGRANSEAVRILAAPDVLLLILERGNLARLYTKTQPLTEVVERMLFGTPWSDMKCDSGTWGSRFSGS